MSIDAAGASTDRNALLFARAQRVIPDRFFWAMPPGEEGEDGAEGEEPAEDSEATGAAKSPRHVH